MTEERFEAIIEHIGDVVENSVESAANRFDKSVNRAWRHRPVRCITKTISFLTGAGLIAGAVPLAENGHPTAAKICFISGGVVIAAGILELIIFRRK